MSTSDRPISPPQRFPRVRLSRGTEEAIKTAGVPRIGEGITIHVGTDKHPGTIVAVNHQGHRFWYVEDEVFWENGYVKFAPAKDGRVQQFSAFLYTHPNGGIPGWRKVGEPNTRITIGKRQYEVESPEHVA